MPRGMHGEHPASTSARCAMSALGRGHNVTSISSPVGRVSLCTSFPLCRSRKPLHFNYCVHVHVLLDCELESEPKVADGCKLSTGGDAGAKLTVWGACAGGAAKAVCP